MTARIGFASCAALLVLALAGCSGPSADPLLGTWECIAPGGMTMTMTFKADGTADGTSSIGGQSATTTFKWSADGSHHLSLTTSEGSDGPSTPYTVSGNTLTITDTTGAVTCTRK